MLKFPSSRHLYDRISDAESIVSVWRYKGALVVSFLLAGHALVSGWFDAACAQGMIPPDPTAIGGGNPFQGLGRTDDPAPSRRSQFEAMPTSYSGSILGGSSTFPTGSTFGDNFGSAFPAATGGSPMPAAGGYSNSAFPAATGGSPFPAANGSGAFPAAAGYAGTAFPAAGGSAESAFPAAAGYTGGPAQNTQLDGLLSPDGVYRPPDSVVQEQAKKQKEKEEKDAQRTKIPLGLIDTPLKKAILELQLHEYDKCLDSINQALSMDETNAQAHYLRGVLYVVTRRFSDARMEYETALRYSQSPDLTRRVRVGLEKLSR